MVSKAFFFSLLIFLTGTTTSVGGRVGGGTIPRLFYWMDDETRGRVDECDRKISHGEAPFG